MAQPGAHLPAVPANPTPQQIRDTWGLLGELVRNQCRWWPGVERRGGGTTLGGKGCQRRRPPGCQPSLRHQQVQAVPAIPEPLFAWVHFPGLRAVPAQAPAGLQQALAPALAPLLAPILQRLGGIEQRLGGIEEQLQVLTNRTSSAVRLALQHNAHSPLPEHALAPVPHPDTGDVPPNFPATNAGELWAAPASCSSACSFLWLGVPARSAIPPGQQARLVAAPHSTLAQLLPEATSNFQRHTCPSLFHAVPAALDDMSYAQLGALLDFYDQPVAGNRQARMRRLKTFIGKPS